MYLWLSIINTNIIIWPLKTKKMIISMMMTIMMMVNKHNNNKDDIKVMKLKNTFIFLFFRSKFI